MACKGERLLCAWLGQGASGEGPSAAGRELQEGREEDVLLARAGHSVPGQTPCHLRARIRAWLTRGHTDFTGFSAWRSAQAYAHAHVRSSP